MEQASDARPIDGEHAPNGATLRAQGSRKHAAEFGIGTGGSLAAVGASAY